MKTLLVLATLFASHSALATVPGFHLQMQLFIDGKQVSKPSVKIEAGKLATVSQKVGDGNIFIDVTTTDGKIQDHTGILMKFAIGTLDASGKKTVSASPEVLVQEGKEARITIAQKQNGKTVKLSVIAKHAEIDAI